MGKRAAILDYKFNDILCQFSWERTKLASLMLFFERTLQGKRIHSRAELNRHIAEFAFAVAERMGMQRVLSSEDATDVLNMLVVGRNELTTGGKWLPSYERNVEADREYLDIPVDRAMEKYELEHFNLSKSEKLKLIQQGKLQQQAEEVLGEQAFRNKLKEASRSSDLSEEERLRRYEEALSEKEAQKLAAGENVLTYEEALKIKRILQEKEEQERIDLLRNAVDYIPEE
jgi:hypothetical protein